MGPGSGAAGWVCWALAVAVAFVGCSCIEYRCFAPDDYQPPSASCSAAGGTVILEEDNWDTHRLITRAMRFVRAPASICRRCARRRVCNFPPDLANRQAAPTL